MNAYIKKIALFSQSGEMREVSLDDGLNIITGDSKTGKSALIEIIDYCLLSSRSTIPVGKITDFTEIFCIIIKISEKYLVIARPHWKSSNRTKAYFSFEGHSDFLNYFSFEYFNNQSLRKLEEVKQDVEQHLGLAVLDTRESSEEDKRNAGKVTMRSFVSLLFQHQNLIANKHSLFYRFDDYQKRKKTIDQLPILLGWVDAEYYNLKQQLDAKKKQLDAEAKRKKSLELNKDEKIKRLRIPIEQYYTSIGYVLNTNFSLTELKKIAQNLPAVPRSVDEDSDIKLQLSNLKDKRKRYRVELSEITNLISQVSDNNTEAFSYGNALNQIILANDFENHEDKIECPICHHNVSEIEDTVKTISSSRAELIKELKNVGKYENDSSEHLNKLIEKSDYQKKSIRTITIEIENLEKSSEEIIKNQSLRETLMHLRGRIEAILEQTLQKPTLAQSPVDINELKSEIEILKERLAGYDLDAKYKDAESFISNRMTEISEKLNFEEELQPGVMRFDLKNFDFYYIYESQKIRLSEMGSGANWLACHLSLFLSLLHLSCKENESCIPSFLMIDQPSQVYFPKVTKAIIEGEGQEQNKTNEEPTFDENIKQVKNIFNVILNEISIIKDDCGFVPQVIVMEHADEKEFNEYVKKRWANDGEKLI